MSFGDQGAVTHAPNLEGMTALNKELKARIKGMQEEIFQLEQKIGTARNALFYIAQTNHCTTCSLVASEAVDVLNR